MSSGGTAGETTFISKNAVVPFIPIVPPQLYRNLAVACLLIGFLVTAAFFIYEVTTVKARRNLFQEFAYVVFASGLLGFGLMFMLLWAGLYF
uniref:Dolichyl-diphosphooligosaccharide-protein glycosyltransferase subunit OST5 n=1 Tax=Chromera velia CCMP2878 TaxID=1169474 RepID=A0A0G4HIG2_9ALVE|mmetsp:Transcript_48014/g.94823  ORF Transcript_48014/g.94823 Transcript_48014/m.94823 type:complete len:92 (-) Transcript_48014:233-508(-)|eukprot:Cvel_27956.t1-p1 / transcript=Cvel_27956.t1 / gene=Cvel_27956 / organism=Chromera_velia_CCMP2878 / gene_product=Transmembrane protein 258, putative / transcript_product=Transmembrane protein 258, putative / location=Cvel_scaffold3569:5316-5735(-) / protein_length=91 / sequence_SO=supercontig / SO=protein_coding / is_pseudo=false